ncbi:uncharacterized protein [Blastocystis hominis]|uniref:Protein kinase domain-containing protein n=1 Tax=Blastocystis hominis TaxID=12968 RepID=D8MA58_BLAHO|nr:uncharacterized protein [Blastocystis hominis]CBK24947.2 unnamed protein product [Blastocystis hominis]|eukprot:XP_012898995.1 uncharacterized protein [Blastocystis hominis]
MDSSHSPTVTSFENLPTQPQVFEEGMRKLSHYRQIAVIGLCKKGDDNNLPVAIKTIHKCLIDGEEEAIKVCDQLRQLVSINHPFILSIRDIFQGGSLYSLVKVSGNLSDALLQFVAVQLILAIHFLHEQNYLFCGLVSENVLLDQDGYIQLTGFSESKKDISFPYYKMVGYMESMSPEMLLNKGISFSYDWYMLGCLLYGTTLSVASSVELSEGQLPFHGSTTTETLQRILIGKLEYKHTSLEAQDFINKLVSSDPEQRMGKDLKELQSHPWIKDAPWENIQNRAIASPLIRAAKPEDPTCYYPRFKEDVIEEEGEAALYNEIFSNKLFI